MESSSFLDKARVPQLDGVRGIAIALVVIWRGTVQNANAMPDVMPGTMGSYVQEAVNLSWSGVDLFFVLSGYLIGGILLDHIKDEGAWRVFYTRRFLRIIPLYFIVLLVAAACAPTNAMPFIHYLSFTQNIWIALHSDWPSYQAATWSLAVEEQFYLLLPLLIWILPRRWLPAVIVTFTLIAPVCRIFAFNFFHGSTAPYVLFPCRMDALFLGVLCAIVMRQERFREWACDKLSILYVIFAASLAWPLIAVVKHWGRRSFEMESFGLTLLAITYSCFLLIAVIEKSGPIAWLTNRALLRRLGILAFCIYLVHGDLYATVAKATNLDAAGSTANWAVWAATMLAVIGIGELSWRFFEEPLIRVGHRWKYAAPRNPTDKVPPRIFYAPGRDVISANEALPSTMDR